MQNFLLYGEDSMLRANMDAGSIKAILRERYGMKNARWIQSAIN